MTKRLLLISLSLFFSICASAQALRFYTIEDLEDYQKAQNIAKKDNKLLLLVSYNTDGGFEQMLKDNVFKDSTLAHRMKSIVPIAMYYKSDISTRFESSFGGTELPAFYFLDSTELLVSVAYGKKSSGELIEAIDLAQKNQLNYLNYQQKYREGTLSFEEWIDLIGIYELNFDFFQTKELALEFLAALDDSLINSPEIQNIVLDYGLDLETPYPARMLKNLKDLDSADIKVYYQALYSYNLDRAIANKDTVLLERIITEVLPLNTDSVSMEELTFITRRSFAESTNQFKQWIVACNAYITTLESDSLRAEFLFKQAYDIAEEHNSNSSQLAALELSQKASNYRSDFRFKMLEAYMLYLQKDFTKAEAAAVNAEQLALNLSDKTSALKLLELIKSEKDN